MSRWFRWYEGTCEDGKFRAIAVTVGVTPVTVIGTWAMILEDASHSVPRGTATRGIKFWHAILGVERSTCEAIINEMEQYGLVTWCGDGDQLIVNKWKDRQFETDVTDPTAIDRMRRYRARKANAGETSRYGNVTAELRPEDRVQSTDTETTSSLRSDVKRASAPAAPKKTKSDGRGTRLTAEWHPSAEDIDYAVKAGVPRPEIARMAEKFRNHWLGKTGAAGVKRDWAATWRNWVIGDCERRGWAPPVPIAVEPRGPPAPGLPTDADLRARYSIPHEAESESDTGEILSDRAGVHRLGDGIERRDKPELRYQPERRGGSGMASLGSLLPLAWRGAGSGRDGAEGHGEIGDGADAMARVVR